MVCVGKNYYAHAKEFFDSGFDATQKETIPSEPIIFTKAMTSLVGPNDAIDSSIDPTHSVDYEGELGVIISKTARRVAKADWQDYVFGYVIINDVTSRELQKKHNQWTIGKGLDTFGPMGPYIVTKDEIKLDRLETLSKIGRSGFIYFKNQEDSDKPFYLEGEEVKIS